MWICMFSFFPRAIIEYNSYLPLTHWLVIALLLYHWSHCYILILRNTSQGVINVIFKNHAYPIHQSIYWVFFFFILPLISHWVSIHLLILSIIVLFPLTHWLFHKILVLFSIVSVSSSRSRNNPRTWQSLCSCKNSLSAADKYYIIKISHGIHWWCNL